jgi:hypothetical protein
VVGVWRQPPLNLMAVRVGVGMGFIQVPKRPIPHLISALEGEISWQQNVDLSE